MGRERAGRGSSSPAWGTRSRRDAPPASTSRSRDRCTWRGVLAAFTLGVAVTILTLPVARAGGDEGQAARGAAVYAFSCAVCHGATGQGFAEAIAAFPATHRDCAACHQPTNAPQMPGSQVGLATMAFSLGDPPALAEPGRLVRFGTAGALFHYLRATMPRWAPGSLADDAYLDLTAHLLRMTGVLGAAETLEGDGLDGKELE